MTTFMYMLAPIEDMTSNAFRAICNKYGADITFTEMIRVEILAKKNKSTWSRLIMNDDTPIVVQLLGAKEQYFKKFLSMFQPSKGFEGFNLNLGCPNPKVVNIGQGCAMIRRISKTRKIVSIFRDYGFKISVKMRLGINKRDKENKIYLNLLNAVDADFFVVHARHGQQSYKEPSYFNAYEECVKTGRTIIANGDIRAKEQIEYLKGNGLKGAMIGRAAIIEPSIFNRLKGIPSPPLDIIFKDYQLLSDRFNEPFRYRKNIFKHRSLNSFKNGY